MKKILWITLWSLGILACTLWSILMIWYMFYIHHFVFRALLFAIGGGYLTHISWKYLREELGGPKVVWNNQAIISAEELRDSSKQLWK